MENPNKKTPPKEASLKLKQDVSNGVLEFTASLGKLLYKQTRQEGNVIFSPINIYSAIALLHLGADGTTRNEISKFMGLPNDNDRFENIHETLSETLQSIENTVEMEMYIENGWHNTKTSTINIANGIFVQKGVDLVESYASRIRSYYKSDVCSVDFSNEPATATNTINEFVSKSTNGRIPVLLENPVEPETRVVLASCLYFKANWKEPFYESATQNENFDTGTGNATVQMMNQRITIPYINLPSLKLEAVGLNYTGRDCSMFFVLPYRDQTLDNVISSLTGEHLRQIFHHKSSTYVNLKIPRMKFKWSETLNDSLVQLGLKEIFDGNAQLQNMLSTIRLKISQVTHAAEIEVDEKGTEASAATVIEGVLMCAFSPPPDPIQFHVDRPFLLFIYHHKTATILFSAAVHNPNGQPGQVSAAAE